MSRRPALATQAEIERIFRASQNVGVSMRITITRNEVRFDPIDKEDEQSPATSFDQWRAQKNGAKKA